MRLLRPAQLALLCVGLLLVSAAAAEDAEETLDLDDEGAAACAEDDEECIEAKRKADLMASVPDARPGLDRVMDVSDLMAMFGEGGALGGDLWADPDHEPD